ncbi:hypothetical protein AGI3411_01926 [Achromobacter agilis]|uniref:Nudix hydrolase domain-containing protein n=2 Tax=Achromobacter agilis TaxID=1353888 RepID=A0A446CB79_9BURK|nr:hypothetical protein AGI3411_01926 [Achromobacter agilis]
MRDGDAPSSPLVWSLWGGAIDADDAGPYECAARELAEELGVSANPGDFVHVGTRQSSTQIALLLHYLHPLDWGRFLVKEGAGAGFFWREEIESIPISASLRYYLDRCASAFSRREE